MTVEELKVLDSNDNEMALMSSGTKYIVEFKTINMESLQENPLMLIQIKDPEDKIKDDIFSYTKELKIGNNESVRVEYTSLEKRGIYTVQVFVWSDFPSLGGVPLSAPMTEIFEVV
jgi:hypothetical protein